jgi:PAS domain S-box-containing protein
MALLLEASHYQAILESLPNGIYVVDTGRRIVFWNGSAERITGYLRHEVIGRSCRDDLLMHCDQSFRVLCGDGCPLQGTMEDGGPREATLLLRHKDGRRLPVWVRALPLRDENGVIVGAVEVFDERPLLDETWSHPRGETAANSIDGITGMSSRQSLTHCLEVCLSDFAVDQVPFSVLAVAVNGLPELSRKHSPEAAQKMLHAVGATLVKNLRPDDVVGHWADDYFLAILRGCPESVLEHRAAMIEGIAANVAILWWGDRLSVTVTSGGAMVRDADTLDSLLARVEAALAAARSCEKRVVIL